MQAWRVSEHSRDPAILSCDLPDVQANDVHIRTVACGLNFADLLLIRGTYQDTPSLPFTLGLEMAGVVESIGPDVKTLRPGDRVACYAGQGGLATQAVVAEDRCVKVPPSVSLTTAAGMLIAYGTSHLALVDRAGLKSGDRLLVTGASGGVGLTAVEIGAALGAEVIAVARGEEKCAIAKAAGAHYTIDSETPDMVSAIRAIGRCDVVYDAVGGSLFDDALRCVAPEARLLVIGFASGDVPQIKANHLMVKNVTVQGLYWGGVLTYAPQKVFDSLARVFDMVAAGQLDPTPHHILPFDQALEGLALLKDRKSTGKVVIEIG